MAKVTYVGPGQMVYPGIGLVQSGQTIEASDIVAKGMAMNREWKVEVTETVREVDGQPYIGFLGNIDVNSGYGSGSIDIVQAALKSGLRVDIDPALGYNLTGMPSPVAEALANRPIPFPDVQIIHTIPDNFNRAIGRTIVGFTMWETSKMPDGTLPKEKPAFCNWAEAINEHCDYLLTPSQASKEVMIANGVTVPITVLNYGLDGEQFPYADRTDDGIFRVGLFGDLTQRKGVWEAIDAFQEAFPNETDVELVLKTHSNRLGVGNYGIPEFSDKRIKVVNQTWLRPQLVDWLHTVDAFLWLSRGEGFGLPPLQAALCGAPVVMTTHTGMAEYYDKAYFYGVEAAGTSAAPLGGEWFEPNVKQAAEHLRTIYKNRKAAQKKAAKAAKYVREQFNYERMAAELQAFLGGI